MPSLEHILIVGGYVGLFLIVFAESGVFAGFFLPGDSLLITAGLLASQGIFNIWILAIVCTVAAIAGDNFGYNFGKYVGPKIFTKEDSLFFSKKRLEETREFFATHGTRTIALARFIPAVRTFTPIFAGVGDMPRATFLKWNIAGGVVWASGLTVGSYLIAKTLPGFTEYFGYIILVVVLTSFIPIAWRVLAPRIRKLLRA